MPSSGAPQLGHLNTRAASGGRDFTAVARESVHSSAT